MTHTDNTEQLGINLVGFHAGILGVIFRQQPLPDHGVDAEFELRLAGKATGRLIAVQVKAGASYFSEETDSDFVFRMKKQHYDYWINHSLPMIVVLCDVGNRVCYWEHITREKCISTGQDYKVLVPKKQTLDTPALAAIEAIASPIAAASDYTIVSEDDLSHAGARRISLKAVIHAQHAALNKPKIAAIARALLRHGLSSNYARDHIVREAHLGCKPDVVWGFIYLREVDIASANWICRLEWISPDLSQNMRPIEQGGEQVGGGLKVEWRMDQEFTQFREAATLSKADYLRTADLCLSYARELLELLRTINSGDHALIKEFCKRAKAFDRWWSSTELSPYECNKLDEVLTGISLDLGNAGIVWSDAFDRPLKQKLYLAKRNEADATDALSYASFLRRDAR